LTVDLNAEDLFDNVELLRSITLRSPECIKVVACDGRLLQMNPAGLVMIETDDWDSVRHACTFDLVAPEHRDAWIANHERVCAGESLVWEFDLISFKGTRRSMETHAAPIALSDGTRAQLAITRDVTERKNSNAALQRLNAALEQNVHERTQELEAALRRLQETSAALNCWWTA